MTQATNGLLTEDDLRAWLGYERSADLEAKLREIGIRYRRAARGGKIITTIDAVNRAMAGSDGFEDIQFGDPDGAKSRKQG